ncbi:MAG: hypothetical protein ABI838_10195, partial [Chloroflexota bacterium]
VTVWVAVPNGDDRHGLRAKNFVATGDQFTDLRRYPDPGCEASTCRASPSSAPRTPASPPATRR